VVVLCRATFCYTFCGRSLSLSLTHYPFQSRTLVRILYSVYRIPHTTYIYRAGNRGNICSDTKRLVRADMFTIPITRPFSRRAFADRSTTPPSCSQSVYYILIYIIFPSYNNLQTPYRNKRPQETISVAFRGWGGVKKEHLPADASFEFPTSRSCFFYYTRSPKAQVYNIVIDVVIIIHRGVTIMIICIYIVYGSTCRTR